MKSPHQNDNYTIRNCWQKSFMKPTRKTASIHMQNFSQRISNLLKLSRIFVQLLCGKHRLKPKTVWLKGPTSTEQQSLESETLLFYCIKITAWPRLLDVTLYRFNNNYNGDFQCISCVYRKVYKELTELQTTKELKKFRSVSKVN